MYPVRLGDVTWWYVYLTSKLTIPKANNSDKKWELFIWKYEVLRHVKRCSIWSFPFFIVWILIFIVSNIYICSTCINEIGWMRGSTIFFSGGGGGRDWVCRKAGGFEAYFRLFYYVGFRKIEVFREGVRIPLPHPTSFRAAHGLANLSEFLIDPMLVI